MNKNTQNILNKAEKLFLTLGIRSVSMDDISRQMGISKKTLYQYFDNKDELVKTVIESHVEREQEEMETISNEAQNALDELYLIGHKVINNIKDVSASTLHDLQKYYRSSFEILMEKQNHFIYNFFIKNIKRGIYEGHYRDDLNPDIIARIFSKSVYFIVEALADPNLKFTKKQMVEELYDYHVRGIATAKGKRLWEKYKRSGQLEIVV